MVKRLQVARQGGARINGVPEASAPIPVAISDTAGSGGGALFSTGNVVDKVDDVDVTMIDNGMPCIVIRASDLGISGDESPEDPEGNGALRTKVSTIRVFSGLSV